jgi:glutathione S-transferase
VLEVVDVLKLYYAPGACSLAAHIVLEESGEKYDLHRVDLANGEQRTQAYLKIHPQGRVPALQLDSGENVTENTAILPYLGKRFSLWPSDPLAETRALSLIGLFAASVHPAHAHISRPERYASDGALFANLQEVGRKSFQGYLEQIDRLLNGRQWLCEQYSVLDPYALTFYAWGVRRELPVADLQYYRAFKDRMLARPAVARVLADEKVKV